MSRSSIAALSAVWLALAAPVHAHVTLDTPQAVALGYVRIAIRVPHGCEGAATTGLRLQVPEGVTAVKPQPKPGWTLTIVPDEAPATGGGHDTASPIREVSWRGGNLPDAYFDEFVLRVRMPDAAGQTVWFAFVQECEDGKVSRWIERPTEGQPLDQLRMPAYPVRLLPRP